LGGCQGDQLGKWWGHGGRGEDELEDEARFPLQPSTHRCPSLLQRDVCMCIERLVDYFEGNVKGGGRVGMGMLRMRQ